jgi:hypothetical protein
MSGGSVLRDLALATPAWASPRRTGRANSLAWAYVKVKSTIWKGLSVTDSVTFLVTSPPLDIKGGVEAPHGRQVHNYNNNTNYHEQYKNT